MEKFSFYKCNKCGNVVLKAVNGGGELKCCDTPMVKLTKNSTEAATEKHIPVVKDNEVVVGSVIHPMTEEHYINFIAIENDKRIKIYTLNPGEEPKVKVNVKHGDKVSEYCNLHGLWGTK